MVKKIQASRIWAPTFLFGGIALFSQPVGILGQSAMHLALVQGASASPMLQSAAAKPVVAPQPNRAIVQSLLDKAHALEVRGRMDLAAQTWDQVLLTDPNNAEALGGLARAAKLNGNTELTGKYLERLRAINPKDPNIAKVEGISSQQSQSADLQTAGRLAQAGEYAEAMAIYRRIWGATPPAGPSALAYYETEAATADGRPHAIAGLRTLVEKFPGESRYPIALGRILTYDPKTREEGRRYLQRYPKEPQAEEALRQSLLWDSPNPSSAPAIRAYLETHKDPQLAAALANQKGGGTARTAPVVTRPLPSAPVEPIAQPVRSGQPQVVLGTHSLPAPKPRAGRTMTEVVATPPPAKPVQSAAKPAPAPSEAVVVQSTAKTKPEPAQAAVPTPKLTPAMRRALAAQDVAAYRALNTKHFEEAEKGFRAVLEKDPEDPRALAGMGYVRMNQSNFSGAISFLEQAKQDKSTDKGLDAALDTSRFWFIMGEGQRALDENDLTNAEKQYRAALAVRPTQPEALEGLSGTLLKAQQPAAALPILDRYIQAKPTAPNAWRGLFLAHSAMGNYPLALATDQKIPTAVHAELMKDPLYLRSLAVAYSSVGRSADAQRVLETALAMPFPVGAKGMKADTQLQFAGLLQAANHLDQAAGLYRQVLAADHANTGAWEGLIRVEHAMNRDQDALQTVESMPPANYAEAMRDPAFEVTVASIYQAQNKLDIAQDMLEKAVAQETTSGQKPPAIVEMQLAGIYLQRNNPQQAYPIFQQVLTNDPNRADAWAGLVSALHVTGHDKEVVAQLQLIPLPVRATLEQNIDFLSTMSGVYSSLGDSQQASVFLARVQQYYAAQHTLPPAGIDIQNAWLLYNGMNDAGLYRQLMSLGGRPDLTEEQRRTVQTIWTNWAVRRAAQASAAGNTRRALAILNATARAFPDNPDVIKALANGYARAGQASEAVLIFKAQNMTSASAPDYRAAIGAALAANDLKQAEIWLRYGLAAFPSDPQILVLGAKFEQARGDNLRAIDYYRKSISAMPKSDPGAELATELSLPAPSARGNLPSASQAQDLSILLAPGADAAPVVPIQNGGEPYLPSYGNVYGQAPFAPQYGPAPNNGAQPNVVPPYMTNPEARPPQPVPDGKTQLKDYVPQSHADEPSLMRFQGPIQADVAALIHQAVAGILRDPTPERSGPEPAGSSVVAAGAPSSAEAPTADASIAEPSPQVYQQRQISRLTAEIQTQPQTAEPVVAAPIKAAAAYSPDVYLPYNPGAPAAAAQAGGAQTPPPGAVAVQLGDTSPRAVPKPLEEVDVLPSARYVANARAGEMTSSHPDIAAAQAAEIRRRQSIPNPPANSAVETSTAPVHDAQYTTQPQNQPQYVSQNAPLVPQPASAPSGSQTANPGQQYPQPAAPPGSGSGTASRRRTAPKPSTAAAPATEAPVEPTPTPAPAQSVTSGMGYPGVGQPLSGQPYPMLGPPYPMGPPPTDQELMARNVPPLRGNFNQVPSDSGIVLTPRQQAERDLASLEGSYSGWIGVTGIARYRSGTPGLDRLFDLEGPVEYSAVVGHKVRLSVIPTPVYLESGTLNTSTFGTYSPSTVPYLGTLPASAVTAPAQQLANGIGGELQLTTRNLGLAAGYTPYEFLVHNVTGRFRWRPLGGHFTLFGDRSPVKDTQLSYAGLRDPGTISPTYNGTIWGGVISTTGGVRVDVGSGGNGFYLSGDGGVLRGDHVLDNTRIEGSMGGYFRVKNWPEYGSLTLGGSLFGMHYAHNEIGLTYGQGGYFSPNSYFLVSMPVTFNGHYKSNFHYMIAGAIGVQTFQEDTAPFFPLNPSIQAGIQSGLGCTLTQLAAHSCGEYPVLGNTGFNYGINSEVSYRVGEHWYTGGFVSGNNTNNYNTISGGFFFRYVFRKQTSTEDYPTGLFPVDGFRPLQIP
jgi:tetratricopeptide (TPR) repeat protein